MNRTYKFAADDPARKDRVIMEIAEEPGKNPDRTAVLGIPKGSPPFLLMEVLDAIKRAYELGREDRSAELLPAYGPLSALRAIVARHAFDAMAGWVQGYTQLEDSPVQYRVSTEVRDDLNKVITVNVQDEPYHPLARFRLRVLVEEVPER